FAFVQLSQDSHFMTTLTVEQSLAKAQAGIGGFLKQAFDEGRIDEQQFKSALDNSLPNLKKWLDDPELDRIARESPGGIGKRTGKASGTQVGPGRAGATPSESPIKAGIRQAVEQERWSELVNAFRKKVSFGTAGI